MARLTRKEKDWVIGLLEQHLDSEDFEANLELSSRIIEKLDDKLVRN